MKEKLTKFFAKCGDWLRREQNPADDPGDARYEALFQDTLKRIKKNPEFYAHIHAGDLEDRILRDEEFARVERLKSSASGDKNSVGNESEQHRCIQRLVELGKAYRPAAEPCPAKDEPKKPAPQPDTDAEKPKINWGQLFAIHGDQPFMVRPEDPHTNLFPEDDDRTYGRTYLFDLDHE